MKKIMVLLSISFFICCCNQPNKSNSDVTVSKQSTEAVMALAKDAYVFGYPLIIMELTKQITTNVAESIPNNTSAPVNQFGHNHSFPDATFDKVVKPNCDTYYSTASLDLEEEPMVLSVPNTDGRYYLLPIMDAYSNVFASPGKRTTGTEAQSFVITGPNYKGNIPKGMIQLKCPTNTAWIIGRTQVNSKEDGEKVVAGIQDGYKLIPLSKFGKDYIPEKHKVDPSIGTTPPPVAIAKMDIETYFNEMNTLMLKNPPAPADAALMQQLATINIGPGKKFRLSDFDAATQEQLKQVPSFVNESLKKSISGINSLENGWGVKRSGMGTYGTDYKTRAFIALIGLGANLNEDACYPNTTQDISGNALNGAQKYILHFDKNQTPPVNAFWSLTAYNSKDLLIANPINRFAIGDRDKLKYNQDGSLDIYIQSTNPGKDKESNWLPSGNEVFTLTMRLYWPKEDFLNGKWKIPGVKKV